MKPNKLTRGHNLIWESSRMMLPEHKELLRQHQKELNIKKKPILDEQEIEVLHRKIIHAYEASLLVEIHLFNPYETIVKTGYIVNIDYQYLQIKLKVDDEIYWISVNDIIHISLMK